MQENQEALAAEQTQGPRTASASPPLWALSTVSAINNKFELGLSVRELTWAAQLIANHSAFVFSFGDKPPQSPESNARTKKTKVRKQLRLAKMRKLYAAAVEAVGDRDTRAASTTSA